MANTTYTDLKSNGVHYIHNASGVVVATAVLDFYADAFTVNLNGPDGEHLHCQMFTELGDFLEIAEYYG